MVKRYSSLLLAFLLFVPAAVRAEDRYFDSNGVRIRYVVEGQGEPVLLIHGFTVDLDVQWRLTGIIAALAKDHQVIAYDNRGHGKSDKPHDPKQYGLEMVEDAVRLLDHLHIKKAHVAGYSMGAMITNKLITVHPDRLLTATLGGAAGIREGADLSFRDKMAEDLEQGKGITSLIVALTPAGRPKPTEDQFKVINAAFNATHDSLALAAVVRGWRQLIIPEAKLKANRIPVLAIVGSQDPLRVGVEALKPSLADVKIVLIDGADHMTAPGRPEFAREMRQFLTAHAK